MSHKKKVSRKHTAGRLMGYVFKSYKLRFFVVSICILVSAMVTVIGSLFIQRLIDDFITPLSESPNPDFSGLLKAVGIMALIYASGVLSTFLYNRMMVSISQGVLKDIRMEMFSKMQSLPIRYFDTHTHGDIMSHYTNDTDALRQMLSQSIPQILSASVSVIFVFFTMVFTNWALTLVVIVGCIIMFSTIKFITGKSSRYFVKQQISLGDINGYIEEMIGGQKVVKVFCHEEKAKEDFDKHNDELRKNADSANKYANILMPIMMNLGNLQYVFIAIVGGLLAVNGLAGMTLGTIAAFLQLSKSFTQPLGQCSQQLNAVIMALAGAQRIFELMDEEPEQDEGYVTLVNSQYVDNKLTEADHRTGSWAWKHPHGDGTVTYTPLTGDVRLFDVDFGYVPEKTVLHNVTIYAKPGQKVAFVGSTGAGKTTITNLINRFYDIADGKIRYDNININKIKKSDLRKSLGIVLQETNLFTGTVKDNIRYGKLDATNEEIIKAAKIANAHDFITRLPEGYDTMLTSNGANLSQGQRQLIAIARAAVADPPVMILDEATSSIDTRTEALVQRGMDRLMEGRTVFVIAHRLSTVRNSDAIMVLEHGRIIERGSHDELIEKRGKYYQLYTGAFELE